jgi:hypothetical protein
MKTIIDKITGKVLFATADDKYEVLNNEIAVDEILIDNFVKPYFNLKTKTFYEGATQDELLESSIEIETTKEDLIKTVQSLEEQLNEVKQQLNNL